MQMPMTDALLAEFDQELATTRRLIERVPDAQLDWKPHRKSMSIGDLATHLCGLAGWGVFVAERPELDLNPDGKGVRPPALGSPAEMLKLFDENARKARAAIAAIPDPAMMEPWTLKNAGAVIFTLPRAAVLRTFVMNHIIHHRGQLTVYLRLRDVPLPSVYGPTADLA
jgi:uncharacterized damage-inducible protein DinB